MVSPLKDNKGTVRYFIGARVDVTALVEDGKTMESFYQLLASDRPETPAMDPLETRPKLKALRDFGELLNDEERGFMRGREVIRVVDSRPSTPTRRLSQSFTQRRFVGIEERISQNGLHSRYLGQLPGVYQNYVLVRPYPSLRITFTSPSLRVPGLCQSKLEDHIGGPEHIRDSLMEALAQGIGVTAKVSWLTRVSRPGTRSDTPMVDDGASIATADLDIIEGKARWIHCTPLTGSDGKVGVIMIVMVDKQDAARSLSSASGTLAIGGPVGPAPPWARTKSPTSLHSSRGSTYMPERWQPRSAPLSDITNDLLPPEAEKIGDSPPPRADSKGVSRLYADYMREIRETQKKGDTFDTRLRSSEDQPSFTGNLRSSEDQPSCMGNMATAVALKAVKGRGKTKKIGGTF